jgi:transcription elongation factor Elf1
MDKNSQTKRAARIQEAAKLNGGMFVFATRDPELASAEDVSAIIKQFRFSEHACTDCSATFHAPNVKGVQYHCASCGSSRTEAHAASKPIIPTDHDLHELTCSSCGTHNILASPVVAASGGHLNCVACGTSLSFSTEAATAKVDSKETATAAECETNMEMSELDDMDMEPDEDDEDGELNLDGDDMEEQEVSADAPDELFEGEEPKVSDNGVPKVEADADEMPMNDYDPDEEIVEMDMMDEIDEDGEMPELSYVYLGESMSVALGTTIVATLHPVRAGDNAPILQTKNFQMAVSHAIEEMGLKKALLHYGFQGARVRFPLKKQLARLVESRVADRALAVTAKVEEVSAGFQQALDIAAAGYATNFWRGKHDPLKASFVTELTTMGVKHAERVVNRVFAAHGVEQSRAILATARELCDMPPEAKNALANAIGLSKYLPVTAADAEDDFDGDTDEDMDEEDEDNDEKAQVARVAVRASAEVPSAAADQVNANYRSPELHAILGGSPIRFS